MFCDEAAFEALLGAGKLVLNRDLPSQFRVNSTLQEILEQVAIESWNEVWNYTSYYENCRASICRYTIKRRFHLPTIITTIIGLIGGFSVILRICTPLIVDLIRREQKFDIKIFRKNFQSKQTNIQRKSFTCFLFRKSISKISSIEFFSIITNESIN